MTHTKEPLGELRNERKLKVFFIGSSSRLDNILNTSEFYIGNTHWETMHNLNSYGFLELFGIDSFNPNFFSTIANSKRIQNIWRLENNLSPNHTEIDNYPTLISQIEKYQPDVIYTNNHQIVNDNFAKQIDKKIKLVLWNASPINGAPNLSHFNLGLSFDTKYLNSLRNHGINKLKIKNFSADKRIRTRHRFTSQIKEQDLIFTGTVSDKFGKRIQLLSDISSNLGGRLNIRYHLLTQTYRYTKVPKIPFKLITKSRQPIFMADMLREFGKSRIVLNMHSDMSSEVKGNMRVFETLANGSFLLTDAGNYPEGLVPGRHFVTYKNSSDAIDKIKYYVKNDSEREEIALQGNAALVGLFSPKESARDLLSIFEEHL